MIKEIKKMGKTGVIAAALAELQKDRVKEATTKLKDLYDKERKAKKVLKNIQREITDYIEELEIDDDDSTSE
jgi:ABC-type enterochelin transport system substrate-binding protein